MEYLKNYLSKPNEEKWKSIENGFGKTAQFPHCLGAVNLFVFKISQMKVDL